MHSIPLLPFKVVWVSVCVFVGVWKYLLHQTIQYPSLILLDTSASNSHQVSVLSWCALWSQSHLTQLLDEPCLTFANPYFMFGSGMGIQPNSGPWDKVFLRGKQQQQLPSSSKKSILSSSGLYRIQHDIWNSCRHCHPYKTTSLRPKPK